MGRVEERHLWIIMLLQTLISKYNYQNFGNAAEGASPELHFHIEPNPVERASLSHKASLKEECAKKIIRMVGMARPSA